MAHMVNEPGDSAVTVVHRTLPKAKVLTDLRLMEPNHALRPHIDV